MVPMIVRVYGEADDGSDGAVLLTDVPVTPHTTCRDVIECCRDPGEDPCTLVETWGGCERPLREDERPLEILQEWGSHQDQVKFVLRYTVLPPTAMNGGRPDTRNGMKEPGPFGELLPEGVELTLGELQEMATRQQHQIDSQHQLLVAKEQRLRYLKQQEVRHQQVAAENERLRRLRDRVEAQELKLRKLRALRGQVDQTKPNNASLTSDLDSIRALFNEKEKELSVAVAKVEELTQQLEELRRGRGGTREQQPPHQSPAALELDKLRRELMYRNKLNEQQNARLSQQREVLSQRQEEMSNIDKRISELQDRLHRKRLLNTQLTNQINATSLKSSVAASGQQPPLRSAASATTIQQQQHPAYSHQQPTKSGKLLRPMTTGNIAAIEPYHHVPVSDCEKHRHHLQDDKMILSQDDFHTKLIGSGNNAGTHNGNLSNKSKDKDEQFLPEFAGSKSDPKYQTLPYNTKFTVNFVSTAGTKVGADKQDLDGDTRRNSDAFETTKNNNNNLNTINNNNHLNYPSQQQQQQQQQHLMTVHSIPLPTLTEVSKGLATPLSQHHGEQSAYQQQLVSKTHGMGHLGPRPFGSTHSNYIQPGLTRGQPVGGSSSSTSSTSSLATNSSSGSSAGHQKPVSSVAPTTVQHQKPSPIYQTSSTKIHPVQPHILSSTPQGILKDLRGELSPPQSSSTPMNTPESYTSQESRVGKPALPPKPAVPVKPTPPPRQTQHGSEENRLGHSYPDPYSHHLSKPGSHQQVPFSGPSIHGSEPEDPPPLPASEPPDEATLGSQRRTGGVGGNCDPGPIIKARPLTIKKQPASEQPRLKTGSGGAPSNVHVSINRRIEMPPAFFFPESEAPPADLVSSSEQSTFSSTQSGSSQTSVETSSSVSSDEVDRAAHDPTNEELENNNVRTPAMGEECNRTDKGEEDKPQILNNINSNQEHSGDTGVQHIVRRGTKKGNLKAGGGKEPGMGSRRVSFDPLALLLDASLEGELELVRKTAGQVANPSAANDEGITALHNAICAGHLDIVMFLVEFGCDVNAQDSDGWTPLHCAASCNNLSMVRFLVEHGACIFATTLSDHETAAEKCEEDEEGFDGCSEYLYSVQEKLGILNGGVVYAVYSYENHNSDELSFKEGEKLVVLRKGDECEREWWWSRLDDREGYIPRNLLGLYPRVHPPQKPE